MRYLLTYDAQKRALVEAAQQFSRSTLPLHSNEFVDLVLKDAACDPDKLDLRIAALDLVNIEKTDEAACLRYIDEAIDIARLRSDEYSNQRGMIQEIIAERKIQDEEALLERLSRFRDLDSGNSFFLSSLAVEHRNITQFAALFRLISEAFDHCKEHPTLADAIHMADCAFKYGYLEAPGFVKACLDDVLALTDEFRGGPCHEHTAFDHVYHSSVGLLTTALKKGLLKDKEVLKSWVNVEESEAEIDWARSKMLSAAKEAGVINDYAEVMQPENLAALQEHVRQEMDTATQSINEAYAELGL